MSSGLDASLMTAEETAFGEATNTLDRGYEFLSESLALQIARLESQGIRAGAKVARTGRWAPGKRRVEGQVSFELNDKGMGRLLKHVHGAVTTTGAGPYVHTFVPGTLRGKSLRLQVGRPDLGGVVRAFTYRGVKVASWELSASLDQFAQLQLTLVGRDEDTAAALVTPEYTKVGNPIPFTSGSLTIAGVTTPVRSITLTGDNGLRSEEYNIGSALMGEPLETTLRDVSGSVDASFADLTAYNRFVTGTEATLVATFGTAVAGLVCTHTVRFDGDTPTVGGVEEIRQPLPFKVLAGADGLSAFTWAYGTTDATP